jgi:hypothetical protein
MFVPEDFSPLAFRDWPRGPDGRCALGYRLDHRRDVAWVRLAATDSAEHGFATSVTAGGTELLVHFDAYERLVGFALDDATATLPPSACVPGAMSELLIQYSEQDDLMQVLFQDSVVGPLDGYRFNVGQETNTSDEQPVLVVAKERSGQLAAIVLERVSFLAHDSLIRAAA